MRTATALRSVLAAAVFAGCGGAPRAAHPHAMEASTSVSPAPRAANLRPLGLELQLVSARGEVEVKASGDWQPLGAAKAGVTDIRASRRGAIVSIGHGDAAGRLWLRAGTQIRIGQAADGVHLSVVAGRARIRRVGASLPLHVDGASGPMDINGDYLLEAIAGTTLLTPTAARPELATWSLALAEAEDQGGAGVGKMEAHGDDGKAEALELRRVSVKVTTHGDMAVTEVTHVFYNPAGGRPREGTFRFPVPDGALLTGMAMEIDGTLVEGEMVERDKARQIYDEVVDQMQDPALLEWEEGNWFKLRVFPIEAAKEKRVVIRYTAPLSRGAQGFEYDYGLAIANAGNSGTAPAAIGDFSLEVDGTLVSHETQLGKGLDLSVPIAPDRVPIAMREDRKDASYVAVRIAPDLARLTAPAHAARKVAFVFDNSRSALEGRVLADQQLAAALGELGPDDQFVVLASDIAVTPSSAAFAAATPDTIDLAKKFLAAIEPDGASDLGLALGAAAALHPTEVIYIGDGIPTWGQQDPAALGAIADAVGAPIHAALIGKGASSTLWSELAGRSGGRAMVVRRAEDAATFALATAHAGEIPRLAAARITVAGDLTAVVFPQQATTVYAGDELIALVRTTPGKMPASLTLTGTENGHPITQTIPIRGAVAEPGVAQRWGQRQIAAMEEQGADRDAIVALSTDLDVMSRYTSLLVLENDEAYKAHQIERKHGEEQLAQAAPTVTGGDLDTLGARQATLSPDEIQPGDPEIKIPAPIDARSVVVSFPFGETKLAVWDDDAQAWMVRFLIDKDTPDGVYQARVAITHADGRVEVLTLPYTVDTQAPAVELTAVRVAGGYQIRARQTGRKDADKVEVQLPDGSILSLDQTARGRFEGVWMTAPLGRAVTVRVVARDHALNQASSELTLGAQ